MMVSSNSNAYSSPWICVLLLFIREWMLCLLFTTILSITSSIVRLPFFNFAVVKQTLNSESENFSTIWIKSKATILKRIFSNKKLLYLVIYICIGYLICSFKTFPSEYMLTNSSWIVVTSSENFYQHTNSS